MDERHLRGGGLSSSYSGDFSSRLMSFHAYVTRHFSPRALRQTDSPPAILLHQGWREGRKTRKRTFANLSRRPKQKIETLRRLLRDETLLSQLDLFTTRPTLPHGHLEAILSLIRWLRLDSLIASQRCRERDLVLAMIMQRLIDPCSKLATTRHWHSITLAEELGVGEASEDDLYQAMDWLLARKERIERKLAARPAWRSAAWRSTM